MKAIEADFGDIVLRRIFHEVWPGSRPPSGACSPGVLELFESVPDASPGDRGCGADWSAGGWIESARADGLLVYVQTLPREEEFERLQVNVRERRATGLPAPLQCCCPLSEWFDIQNSMRSKISAYTYIYFHFTGCRLCASYPLSTNFCPSI